MKPRYLAFGINKNSIWNHGGLGDIFESSATLSLLYARLNSLDFQKLNYRQIQIMDLQEVKFIEFTLPAKYTLSDQTSDLGWISCSCSIVPFPDNDNVKT